jgi:hypothetical protein
MTERTRKFLVSAFVALATIASALVFVPQGGLVAPSEARAVIGRPLTPVSYAGVARRTVRRTTRRGIYY